MIFIIGLVQGQIYNFFLLAKVSQDKNVVLSLIFTKNHFFNETTGIL